MTTTFKALPSQVFPKPVTQCWTTSDGKIHADEGVARSHEEEIERKRRSIRLVAAVAAALADVRFYSFGVYRFDQAMDARFEAAIAKRLVENGLEFKDARS